MVSSSFLSCLNDEQVIRNVHDAARRCLRVCVVGIDVTADVNVINTDPICVKIVGGDISGRRVILDETDILKAGLDINTYTEIFSYTSIEDIDIRAVKVKADTYGVFRVKIDGTIQDYYRTSEMGNNCFFDFTNVLDLADTEIVSIEFRPYRLNLTTYNFFMRIEAQA